MCLAVPAQVERIDGPRGTVALEGVRSDVSLALVPDAAVGDWVLVHAGYAITRLDEEDARRTYDLLRSAGEGPSGGVAG